jgi:hypothetical protein
MTTIDELRERKAAVDRELAEAEASLAARPPLAAAEVAAIFDAAITAHGEATTQEDKHAVASAGLLALEEGKHKGREVDILAQHVIDARGAITARAAPAGAEPAPIEGSA